MSHEESDHPLLRAIARDEHLGKEAIELWPAFLRKANGETMKTYLATVDCRSGQRRSTLSLCLDAFTEEEARFVALYFLKKPKTDLRAGITLDCPHFKILSVEEGEKTRVTRLVKENKGQIIGIDEKYYHVAINMIKMEELEKRIVRAQSAQSLKKKCEELKDAIFSSR